MMSSPRSITPRLSYAALGLLLFVAGTMPAADAKWWKGNLHTHSLWSDGDEYPEMVADWYKENGYHFLAISDHNEMHQGQRWLNFRKPLTTEGDPAERGGGRVLGEYKARFGDAWVEMRQKDGVTQVRLKPLAEYRSLLEEAGRFVLIPSSEITRNQARPPTTPPRGVTVHINATNLRDPIPAVEGDDVLAVMQQTVDLVLAQREATGQAMFPHINHPNFKWGVSAEQLMRVKGERFFEVYNGHPGVNNAGDATHASTDKIWDRVLAFRLTHGLGAMYGLAVDDAHHYHRIGLGRSNAGRGWVVVRAAHLTAESLVHAMEAGDFYASTGVVLDEVDRAGSRLSLKIAAQPGTTYVTQFIGTRKAATGPDQVGIVLQEGAGLAPSYTLKGDELYVRANVTSSKLKENGSVAGEFETAWTQPLLAP